MNHTIKSLALPGLIIGMFLVLIIAYCKQNRIFQHPDQADVTDRDKKFEQQIKFRAPAPETLDVISNLRTIDGYKKKSLGVYDYQDYYYDSPDYAIAKSGYSYRFRTAHYSDGTTAYRLQYKKEYDAASDTQSAAAFIRTEIDVSIPPEQAQSILAGDFNRVFRDHLNIDEVKKLNMILAAQGIDLSRLSPVLFGQQDRDRISLKKDDIPFFEMSLDRATFKNLKNPGQEIAFCEVELENKYKKGYRIDQPVILQQEIQGMVDYLLTAHKLELTKVSKYQRVLTSFSLIKDAL